MPKGKAVATLDGQTIAETEEWEFVENNVYFPPSSVHLSFLNKTDHVTTCPWKGEAKYYTINLETEHKNAAWYYPEPKEAANHIKDHIAFYKNVVTVQTEG